MGACLSVGGYSIDGLPIQAAANEKGTKHDIETTGPWRSFSTWSQAFRSRRKELHTGSLELQAGIPRASYDH
jgi:hypothetical protein